MIANRLNILLAERQLSIKDVVEGTGLSRNTLSNLINKNTSNSINLSTLNKLCMFLEIEPESFFVFSPYNLKFDAYGISMEELKRTLVYVDDNSDDLKKEFSTLTTKVEHFNEHYSLHDSIELRPYEISHNVMVDENGTTEDIESYPRVSLLPDVNKKTIDDSKIQTAKINQLINNSLNIMFKKSTQISVEEVIEKCALDSTDFLFYKCSKSDYMQIDFIYPWGEKKKLFDFKSKKLKDLPQS